MSYLSDRVRAGLFDAVGAFMLLLAPTSYGGNWTSMECPAEPGIAVSTITWQRTADPQVTCAALGAVGTTLDRGGACISCVVVAPSVTVCTVYAEKPGDIDDAVLGHETKHAFGCMHGKYF